MIVSILRFRSGLTDEEVQDLYEACADRYQQVPSLVEKLYLRYRSGDHGALYVWESDDALEAFRASDLGRSIGPTYKVEGEPVTELADVTLLVEPELSAPEPSPRATAAIAGRATSASRVAPAFGGRELAA